MQTHVLTDNTNFSRGVINTSLGPGLVNRKQFGARAKARSQAKKQDQGNAKTFLLIINYIYIFITL